MIPATLRTVCAWCQRILREGAEPTSHGICPACRATHFPSRSPVRHVAYVPRPGYRALATCQLRRLPVALTIARVGAWTLVARHDHLAVN
jgi:hypothetical protein